MDLLTQWLHEALGNWQGWVSGGGVGGFIIIVIALIERLSRWRMPNPWYATIVLAGFFCGANFVAWSSAFQSMKGRERDLRAKELEFMQASKTVKILTADKITEPSNSLRRRAKQLAEEIDLFRQERDGSAHPPRSNGQPDAAGDQLRINQTSDAYDAKTIGLCVAKFGERIHIIPREMASKGIPMQYLDQIGPERCMHDHETALLRLLAYRLDGQGVPVEF